MANSIEKKRLTTTNLDESLEYTRTGIRIWYQNRKISNIAIDHFFYIDGGVYKFGNLNEGEVVICYSDGTEARWRSKYLDLVSNRSYGIALSFDCRYIYEHQLNGGLACLSVIDGALIWKSKFRFQVYNVMVNPNGTLCCSLGYNNKISVIDHMTGAELRFKKYHFENQFEVITKNRILVETSKSWHILDSETLDIVEVIDKKEPRPEPFKE